MSNALQITFNSNQEKYEGYHLSFTALKQFISQVRIYCVQFNSVLSLKL